TGGDRRALPADMIGHPRLDHRDAGIDTELHRPGAAFAPADDAGLEIAALAVGNHQRPAAVALAGVMATLSKARAHHGVGDGAAIRGEAVAHLGSSDLYRDVVQH